MMFIALMSMVLHWLEYLVAGFAVCGIAYYALCIWSAIAFWIEVGPRASSNFAPGITILKPVHGTDPGAYESFRSHCLQQYPEYEIVFGVSDMTDPAVPLVQQLMREFPERKIKLIACPQPLGMNRKVSNLVQMLPHASYDYLLVNDGDIRVPEEYLRRVVAPFADERVGLVTCLYRGMAAGTLGSRLEALGISTDFSAGVLTARRIEGGIRFGLGSTLCFSRKALAAIGGLEPLVDYLADDYELGERIASAGLQVVLADVTVETFVPAYAFKDFLLHQLRWARSTRDSRPYGYTGLLLTFGLPWALLAALLARGAAWSWKLLAVAAAARILMALTLGLGELRDRQVLRDLLLLPLRDLIALGVWAASFAGHKVSWRGTYFILEDGKLRPAA